ncbi:hypothetical protein TSOC_004008, partial [Tetrabaena socialis]
MMFCSLPRFPSLLGPLQRLQHLQRTTRQHELDLEVLSTQTDQRAWQPYLAVGLRQRPQPQSQPAPEEGSVTVATAELTMTAAVAVPIEVAEAEMEAAEVEPAALAPHTLEAQGEGSGKGSESGAGGAGRRRALAAAAAGGEVAAAGLPAAADAREAAAAEARAGALPAEGTSLEAGVGPEGVARDARAAAEATQAAVAAAAAVAVAPLKYVEVVLRAEGQKEELQAELQARRDAAQRGAELLRPGVEAGLQRLRDLLSAAAANDSSLLAAATAGGYHPTDILADPNDLELYDLLLGPCVTARLDPRNYVSYPPRPLVSVVLSYSGQRMPYVVDRVVQPLLACAAGADGGGARDGAGTAEGDGSSSGGGAARRVLLETGDGGSSSNSNSTTSPSYGEGLALELLVGFDHPAEAAGWALVAAESGGRVVPVFRPAGGGAGGGGGAAAGAVAATPPLLAAVNRLAAMARGDLLLVMQDGDELPDDGCSWLRRALRAFEAWPRLGAVGSGRFVMDWHPASLNAGLLFWDEANSLPMQFVTAATMEPAAHPPSTGRGGHVGDYDTQPYDTVDGNGDHDSVSYGGGPLAVRRSAWRQLGGLDELGLGDGALCGGCAPLDLSTRLWLSGWQVAHMPMEPSAQLTTPGGAAGQDAAPGGAPWCSQQEPQLARRTQAVCSRVLRMRYGESPYWYDGTMDNSTVTPGAATKKAEAAPSWFMGSDLHATVTEHVRQLNLRRLRRLRGWDCPFGAAGCEVAPLQEGKGG